jgi:hypothetical protein
MYKPRPDENVWTEEEEIFEEMKTCGFPDVGVVDLLKHNKCNFPLMIILWYIILILRPSYVALL